MEPQMPHNDKHKLLIFIVAYNAEATLLKVLDRIPKDLFSIYLTEVLVIDDASSDRTFELGQSKAASWTDCKLTILTNPVNQGYGGNQKLGYEYAIQNGYNSVALLHGDGQYAPEMLPDLVKPLAEGQADAVFGSRMMIQGGALKGGMPMYKFVGNKILSTFQNTVLQTSLTEFHSGFRAYSIETLKKIPFKYNSNDFHFDTDIIIQLIFGSFRVLEIPMPTYYGDEVCYVNGMKYAKDVVVSTLQSQTHQMGIKYQRKFDIDNKQDHYDIKLGYPSSHTIAIDAVPEKSKVLDIGCGPGLVAKELKKKSCYVIGLDKFPQKKENISEFIKWDLDSDTIPEEVSNYDYILMLDIIEHLKNPEQFMDLLRKMAKSSRPNIVLTTANVTFFIPRLMFLLGQFNYGKSGILDFTHTRLFTFSSMKDMLAQCGYEILEIRGIPAPFPKAIKNKRVANTLVELNTRLIKLSKSIFSYQMYFLVKPLPMVNNLLDQTINYSKDKQGNED